MEVGPLDRSQHRATRFHGVSFRGEHATAIDQLGWHVAELPLANAAAAKRNTVKSCCAMLRPVEWSDLHSRKSRRGDSTRKFEPSNGRAWSWSRSASRGAPGVPIARRSSTIFAKVYPARKTADDGLVRRGARDARAHDQAAAARSVPTARADPQDDQSARPRRSMISQRPRRSRARSSSMAASVRVAADEPDRARSAGASSTGSPESGSRCRSRRPALQR